MHDDTPLNVPLDLRSVSTQWSQLSNVHSFVLRYADPMRSYLERLLASQDDAEEVLQRLLVKMLENGFRRATPDRGKFRHYLIRSVRNEARSWQREQGRRGSCAGELLSEVSVAEQEQWDLDWHASLIDRAWESLLVHEETYRGSLCHTVLTLATDSSQATSEQLAQRVSEQVGRELSGEAYRKQLSRARRLFAESIVQDVSQTLDAPSPEDLIGELAELKLMQFVKAYLPGA